MRLRIFISMKCKQETYLPKHVVGINTPQAFLTRKRVNSDEFICNIFNDTIIVSGDSDEKRSVLLLGLTRSSKGCIVILHNGNRYITADRLRRCGINASLWCENVYFGFSKTQLLSILTADDSDVDWAFFYSYAFEVCEVLNKSMTV